MTKKNSDARASEIILLVALLSLVTCMELKADNSYFMALKNDKVSVLNSNPTHYGPLYEHEQTNLMWIYNDQQSITV